MTVYAEEKEQGIFFKMNIITSVSGSYTGDFLYQDETLYVELETLRRMTDFSYQIQNDDKNYDGIVEREGYKIRFLHDDVVLTRQKRYISYIKAFTELGLNGTLGESNRTLLVTELPNIRGLDERLFRIYFDSAYGMTYWRDGKYFGLSKAGAMAADAVKNFQYSAYKTHRAQTDQYKNAFWNIISPQEDADISFYQDTSEVVTLLKECREVTDDASEFLLNQEDGGFFGDYGLCLKYIGKTMDWMQMDEMVEMVSFMRGIGEAEESCIRGLEDVIQSSFNSNVDMKSAGKYTLDQYKGKTPIWASALTEIYKGALKDLEEFIFDKMMPHKFIADAVNLLADEFLHTQEQVDATLKAVSNLEIQLECKKLFQNYRNQYFGSMNWEKRVHHLGDMRDAMMVYLKAGREAYRAVMIDKEMEAAANKSIERINEELDVISAFPQKCFTVYTDALKTQDALGALAVQLSGNNEAIQEGLEDTFTIAICWDHFVDGVENQLEFSVSGMMDNGGTLIYSEQDHGYYTEDGTLVASLKEETGKINLELHNTEGILYFEVTNGEDWVTKGTHIDTTNYRIDLIKNGEIMDTIDTGSLDYKIRSYTGLWFCSFSLDHGILNPYNPLEGLYPSWMMEGM
ncbi:MAG: hypothetical protein IKV59_01585 [Lachnospiraceae bacterium]|nr:hypothetical protein [Lachnospiraceae bacterium]